jgi:hypothetical protein
MNIGEKNPIQGFSARDQGHLPYMQWQNLIEEMCGVQCTVKVELKQISIRTADYADFVLAKSVVSKRTGLEVVRG